MPLMQLPANFDPTPLGIESVEQLMSWCFETMIAGYGPGEYRPNNGSAIDYELIPITGLDGNKTERVIITASLKVRDDIAGLSLRPWQKIEEFTTNTIPPAFLVAV